MKTTTAANRTYLAVKATAYLMFALGLALSVTHIFDLFHGTLGSSVLTAAAVPVFIDGFQLVGRLIRGEGFAESTRKTGLWLQMFGAAVSLAANIVAGPTPGDKIGGAIFVIGYITIEAIAEKIRPAADDTAALAAAQAQAAENAAAAAAAKKAADDAAAAAAQLAADAAAKAEADAKEAARKASLSRRAKNAAATRRANKLAALAAAETVETAEVTVPAENAAAYL